MRPISALTGAGVESCKSALFGLLPEVEPLLDPALTTTQSERFFVAELIREAMLERVAKELPFPTAVHIRQFCEDEESASGPLLRVVGRHRGRPGQPEGDSGGPARRDDQGHRHRGRQQIETLLGARVYLDLQVKAQPGWREDHRVLVELSTRWKPFDPGRRRSTSSDDE